MKCLDSDPNSSLLCFAPPSHSTPLRHRNCVTTCPRAKPPTIPVSLTWSWWRNMVRTEHMTYFAHPRERPTPVTRSSRTVYSSSHSQFVIKILCLIPVNRGWMQKRLGTLPSANHASARVGMMKKLLFQTSQSVQALAILHNGCATTALTLVCTRL